MNHNKGQHHCACLFDTDGIITNECDFHKKIRQGTLKGLDVKRPEKKVKPMRKSILYEPIGLNFKKYKGCYKGA